MTKEAFEKIASGLREAIAIAEGKADPSTYRVHVPPTMDVRALRKRLKLTQAAFAAKYGFNIARLRDWEQGRSAPDSALCAYLTVIDKQPEAVEKALAAA